MKKTIVLLTGIAGLLLLASAMPTMAADEGAGKKVTITGMGKCAKCALHETDTCQNVIEADEHGKKVQDRVRLASNHAADNSGDDDLRLSLAKLKAIADSTGIPDEPFKIKIGTEVKKLVDKALAGK